MISQGKQQESSELTLLRVLNFTLRDFPATDLFDADVFLNCGTIEVHSIIIDV